MMGAARTGPRGASGGVKRGGGGRGSSGWVMDKLLLLGKLLLDTAALLAYLKGCKCQKRPADHAKMA